MIVRREVIDETDLYAYIHRREAWTVGGFDEEPVEMEACYGKLDGGYIGDPDTAAFLCNDRGIVPQKRTPESDVCSIGFCPREQKWYGWSHRALAGFGVGDRVEEGHVTAARLPVGYVASDLEGARLMACAFAEGVA